jgi:hypothetical protein
MGCVTFEAMTEIHNTLANMISLYSLIMAGWGFFNFARRRPPDGSFNGALAVAVGLYIIEGLVGIILLLMGQSAGRSLHWLYGVTMALTIPAIFVFTRGRNSSLESFLYGAGMLFIWGLADRAAETGR